jgi:hypothetical protein
VEEYLIDMKMGSCSTAVVVAMALVVMSMGMRGAEAQGASCLNNAGAGAPFGDAAAVVQQLRVTAGPCCNSGGGFCSVLATSGNAAATICGDFSPCPNCADVGNDLNQVLAQCNVLNEVQGVYSTDGTSEHLFYLTSNSEHP